jgi:hypothetical protein
MAAFLRLPSRLRFRPRPRAKLGRPSDRQSEIAPASVLTTTRTPSASSTTAHPVRRLVHPAHRSTAQEREDCRARLAERFESHLDVVCNLLAGRPAELRTLVRAEPGTIATQDLAAVRAYLRGDLPHLDRALRDGTAEPDRAVAACLVSGLRRLPLHHGPCFTFTRSAAAAAVALDAYSIGRPLFEPAFLRADAEWSPSERTDDMNSLVTYAIWSYSSRRVTLLEAEPNSVAFAAGTSFLVLDVEQATDGSGAATVFLAERRAHAPHPPGAREERILEHLKHKLAARSAQAGRPARPVQSSVQALQSQNAGWFEAGHGGRAGGHRPSGELGELHDPAGLCFALGLDESGRPFANNPVPAPTRSGDDAVR